MLKSKYDDSKEFKATKIFADRVNPRKVFKKNIKDFYEERFNRKIIVFYGKK